MIHGVGCDILRKSRLSDIEDDQRLLEKLYSPDERKQAVKRESPFQYFCTRFAGKEAVLKALRVSQDEARMNEISILSEDNGKPYVELSGEMRRLAGEQGVTALHISLSWEEEYAVAYAIAERDK